MKMVLNITKAVELDALICALDEYVSNTGEYVEDVPEDTAARDKLKAAERLLGSLQASKLRLLGVKP